MAVRFRRPELKQSAGRLRVGRQKRFNARAAESKYHPPEGCRSARAAGRSARWSRTDGRSSARPPPGAVAGVGQLGGCLDDAGQDAVRVEVGGDRHDRVEQRLGDPDSSPTPGWTGAPSRCSPAEFRVRGASPTPDVSAVAAEPARYAGVHGSAGASRDLHVHSSHPPGGPGRVGPARHSGPRTRACPGR